MILIFGKTGQVALELQRQAPAGETLVALGRDQADLTRPETCAQAIREHAPTLVINAAAYTAVDRAEEEEETAHLVNAEAPGAMARACAGLGIPFCHVSTDYVFDGAGETPFKTTDPVAPLGVYGRSKLAGEEAVQAAGGTAAILRTSWVFSSHGNNFVKTMLRLSETRDALSIVDDQIGGPTPAADIAATLLRMGARMREGQTGGLYHFSGSPDVSWADFAAEIFAQAGRDVKITRIPSADYPTPARRPLNSRLDCAQLATDFGVTQPAWKEGLALVLKELGAT
jgi:dTDP-4-dehydrorhamnose reductase